MCALHKLAAAATTENFEIKTHSSRHTLNKTNSLNWYAGRCIPYIDIELTTPARSELLATSDSAAAHLYMRLSMCVGRMRFVYINVGTIQLAKKRTGSGT